MNKSRSRARESSPKRIPHCLSDDNTQYLLKAEEQIYRAISARAPLSDVLNGICDALDCQMGNMVSLIYLPGDDPIQLAAITWEAEHCGLYLFCSEDILAENDEQLGSLEMYCSYPVSPTDRDLQLIERAKCLAALAIKRDIGAGPHDQGGATGNSPVQANLHVGRDTVN